jgi:hypothetical protein
MPLQWSTLAENYRRAYNSYPLESCNNLTLHTPFCCSNSFNNDNPSFFFLAKMYNSERICKIMEAIVSLPCWHKASIALCPEPLESNLQLHSLFCGRPDPFQYPAYLSCLLIVFQISLLSEICWVEFCNFLVFLILLFNSLEPEIASNYIQNAFFLPHTQDPQSLYHLDNVV